MNLNSFVGMLDGGPNTQFFAFKLLDDHVINADISDNLIKEYIGVIEFYMITLKYSQTLNNVVTNKLLWQAEDHLGSLQDKLEGVI